jgi:hypothetical protein
MTITFESDKDVVIYTLEKIISYARDHQYIFLAQSVWWISSIIGFQSGLVIHINNLKIRDDIRQLENLDTEVQQHQDHLQPSRAARIQNPNSDYSDSEHESITTTETEIQNDVIHKCEVFLEQSKQERKAIGLFSRQASRVVKCTANENKSIKTFRTETEGIDGEELRRREAAGEWQRCAWPRDRKGSHKTIDCFQWK